jgi:hypothetical protein
MATLTIADQSRQCFNIATAIAKTFAHKVEL